MAASFTPDRREFVKLAVGALGAAGALSSPRTASATVHPVDPGIKLCAQTSAKPTDEELLFLKQMGCGICKRRLRRPTCAPPMASSRSRSAMPMPALRSGTSATPACTTCRRSRSICPAAMRRSKSTSSTSATSARRASTTPPMPTWATASGAVAAPRFAAPRRASSIWPAPTKWAFGTARNSTSRSRTAASSPRTRSGKTTPTSSSRLPRCGRKRRPHRHPSR